MKRTKEFRREKEELLKKQIQRKHPKLDEAGIGLMYSTHCKPCSCFVCDPHKRSRKYDKMKGLKITKNEIPD